MSSQHIVHIRDMAQLVRELRRPQRALVMCHATWCGACKNVMPVVRRVAPRLVDRVLLVNEALPGNKAILREFQVQAYPTFILKGRGGGRYVKWAGGDPEKLVRNLRL